MEKGDDGRDDRQHQRLEGEKPNVGEQHLLNHHQELNHEHSGSKKGDALGGERGMGHRKIRRSKAEIRKKSEYRNPKIKASAREVGRPLWVSDFGLRSDFGF